MTYDDLEDTNRAVNRYEYKTEIGDDWTPASLGTGVADCDSYATEKTERLLALGWPKKALRLAYCQVKLQDGKSEGHLVLLADYQDQTWVLDNRYPYPMRYQDLGSYTWVKFWHVAKGPDAGWEFA